MHRLVVGDLNGLGHGVYEPHTKLSPSDLPSRWSPEIGQGGPKNDPKMSTHFVPDLRPLATVH